MIVPLLCHRSPPLSSPLCSVIAPPSLRSVIAAPLCHRPVLCHRSPPLSIRPCSVITPPHPHPRSVVVPCSVTISLFATVPLLCCRPVFCYRPPLPLSSPVLAQFPSSVIISLHCHRSPYLSSSLALLCHHFPPRSSCPCSVITFALTFLCDGLWVGGSLSRCTIACYRVSLPK